MESYTITVPESHVAPIQRVAAYGSAAYALERRENTLQRARIRRAFQPILAATHDCRSVHF